MVLRAVAAANLRRLGENAYPGRGLVLGLSADGSRLVQVYWLTGRSPASRNRVLLQEGESVKAESLDPSQVPNPDLVIYHPVRRVGSWHVVSNGDQTDTLAAALARGERWQDALATREYEPDAPHWTPRISGLHDAADPRHGYALSILKAEEGDGPSCVRQHFLYERGCPGIGHCLTTYAGDGHPLPSFAGEPWPVPLPGSAREMAQQYWELLPPERRVALLVKTVEFGTGATQLEIVNRHGWA